MPLYNMRKISLTIFSLFLPLIVMCQSFDAELIDSKTNIEISDGKLIKNESFEIKINNRTGEEYTKITIPFSKLYKVSQLEAYIKNTQGEIVRKLKNNEITQRSNISDFSLYEDDYVKEFTLKHNKYPYYVYYYYQVQENEFINIENWIPVLDSEIPTINAELSLTIPKDYSIRFQNKFVDKPHIDTLEKAITYHWKTTYNEKLKKEKYAPHLSIFLPSVSIIPNEFKFALKGSFYNWNDYINWMFQLIKNTNTLTENEKSKITSQISGIESETEKVRKLYHYLQDNTRYINVSIDKGGIKPYPASYVCENKYGDCKALSNYFKSVLEFVGIKSYYTLVYAGEPNRKQNKDFPDDIFNHIILYVPLKNDTVWLDCTSKGPFNYLGTFTQNRDALVIDDVNGGFVYTPALKPEDVLEVRNINISYEKDQPTKINFKNNLKGEMFEKIRQLEHSYNEHEKDYILRNYIVDDELEMTDYQIIKKERDDKSIQLIYNAKSSNIYKKYGNEIVVSNIPFEIPKIEKPSERKLPVQIDYPVYKLDTLNYNFPEGYTLSNKPEDFSILSIPFGSYSMKFIPKENFIQVIKSMQIYPGEYPLEKYQEFYNFINIILNFEKGKHIILKSKN
ncbi:conserved exported hypothetical protein [uncultured Paludibacter sp.]|nr:conserved exported hypothetical protein [uncultured Paludibacter sp.]